MSRVPGELVATTGTPHAMASTSTLPNPSYRELNANTSARAMYFQGLLWKPANVTACSSCFCETSARSEDSRSPLPRISRRTGTRSRSTATASISSA